MWYDKKNYHNVFLTSFFAAGDLSYFFFFLANDIELCNCWWLAGPPGSERIYCGGGRKTNTHKWSFTTWCPRLDGVHAEENVTDGTDSVRFGFYYSKYFYFFFFFNPSELRARFIRAIKFRRKTKIIIKKKNT